MDNEDLPNSKRLQHDASDELAKASRVQGKLASESGSIHRKLRNAGGLLDSIKRTMRIHQQIMSPIMDAMTAQSRAITALSGPITDVMSARVRAIKAMSGPITDVLESQARTIKVVSGLLSESVKAQDQALKALSEPITDAMTAQNRAIQAIMSPVIDLMRAHDDIQRSILGSIDPTTFAAALFGIASPLGQLSPFKIRNELNATIAQALNEVEIDNPAQSAGENEALKSFQLNYDKDRQALSEELARRVSNFDALPASNKIVQLLDVVITNPSSSVANCAFAVAMGLLSDMLGEADPQKVIGKAIWLVMFMLFGLLARLSVKQRVPKTRQILRALPFEDHNSRIVIRTCIISDQPRSRSVKVGWLTIGALVTVTDRLQGWRQVYFTNNDGRERVGWVRSKYLRDL